MSSVPGAPGPPAGRRSVTPAGVGQMTSTWIGEQHALLLVGGRAVLDYGKTCVSSSVIVVVHRDLVVTAFEVRVGGVDTENRAIFPCNVVSFGGLGTNQSLKTKVSSKGRKLTS